MAVDADAMTPAAVVSWPIVSRLPLVGDLAISPHGIAIGLGFVLGALVMLARVRRRGVRTRAGVDVDVAVTRLLARAALGAIVGARAAFVLTHLDQFAAAPADVLAIHEGGLSFLGGVAGAVLVGWWIARRWGLDPMLVLDSAMPGLALGLVVGRLGDLAIGDHLGAPTDFVLGWRCAGDHNPVGGPNALAYTAPVPYPEQAVASGAIAPPTAGCFDAAVHQTALYDLLAAAVVLGLLLWLERRARFDGFFVVVASGAYGLLRFVGDFARLDRRLWALTGSQWALLALMMLLGGWLWRVRPWEARPWAWTPGVPDAEAAGGPT